jgi:hypothetical protein
MGDFGSSKDEAGSGLVVERRMSYGRGGAGNIRSFIPFSVFAFQGFIFERNLLFIIFGFRMFLDGHFAN